MANKSKAAGLSRYEQVKLILNTAQGDQCPDYDGYRRFWELPVAELKCVKIYGIQMIASDGGSPVARPAALPSPGASSGAACCPHSGAALPPVEAPKMDADASCCGTSDSSSSTFKAGRGAASGLIKGLKGEWPYDNTQFPPLLWGTTKKVSVADIDFISSWIDDGCPTVEESQSLADRLKLAMGKAVHNVASGMDNEARMQNGQLHQRKNVEELTPEELARYRRAIKIMKSRPEHDSRGFDYFGRVHGNSCQHGWEKFLTWHRAYFHQFEQELQDIDPAVALHYWDWSNPMYNTTMGNQTIPEAYKMWITLDGIKTLQTKGLKDADATLLKKFVDKKYATLDELCYDAYYPTKKKNYYDFITNTPGLKQAFYDVLLDINTLWCPYRYLTPTKQSYKPSRYKNQNMGSLRETYHHHYPTQDDVDEILAINNFADFGGGPQYNQSFGALDMDPHNTIHIWSGGSNPNFDASLAEPDKLEPATGWMLSNLTTGFDPIFYAHHSNIDRLWAKWQELHPGLTPDDGNSILTPFNMLVRDTYDYRKLGYEYALQGNYVKVDPSLDMTKFKSGKLGISKGALHRHKKAEVKLHNVTQPNQSLIVSVFLNLDDPQKDSKQTHPDNFVGGFTMFGHGQCIGSAGHCDPPPKTRRAADHRGQHHNTPWNYNLDATACIKKLCEKGAKDFHVNILAVGTDGAILSDMLRLEAVSLDFKE